MKIFDTKISTKWFAAAAVVIFFLFVHEAYVTRAHPDAPYMDTLRLVYQLEQWLSGRLPFFKLWSQGQHKGFILQLFLLANIKLFSLNVMLANRLTGVVVAIFSIMVLFSFLSATRRYDNTRFITGDFAQAVICSLFVAICFSWAGFELFTLDLGLPLWTKNVTFMVYFVLHACYLRMPSGLRSTWVVGIALTLLGPVVVLMVAMGWSYSFVASVALVSTIALVESIRQGKLQEQLKRCAPVAALFVAQLIYMVTSGEGGRSANQSLYTTLIHVPDLLLYSLGSGVIGLETVNSFAISPHIPELIGAGMLASAISLGLARFWRRSVLARGSLIPLYLLAYGLFTALSVSVARGHNGPAEVMASRYYMDIMLFCIGLVWLWYESLAMADSKRFSISAVGFSVLCSVIVVGQWLTYAREWRAAPYRAIAFKAMNEALLDGVPDQAAATLLQSPFDNARLGDKTLREKHLALYSNVHFDSCDAAGVQLKSGWYGRESQGIWMGKNANIQVAGCRCDFIIKVYLPPDFIARTIKIQSADASKVVELTPGKAEQISLGPILAPEVIGLSVSDITVPAKMPGASPDIRSLGVDLTGYGYLCGAGTIGGSKQ